MQTIKKYRYIIAVAVLILAGIGIILLTHQPLPETTNFKSGPFSFSYSRGYDVNEYASGVVSVGHGNKQIFSPLVEVDRYQSDPDEALPASFDVFMKKQAAALCGADGPKESISCTQVGVADYTSAKSLVGKQLTLTLVKKNLSTGTTTSESYGPMYVFNTTASSTPDSPLRYSAIFVYPSLAAFLAGTSSPALEQQIVDTLTTDSGK